MIRPLLKIIPALSGNIKLACELNTYYKISDNEFNAVSRIGHLFPLFNKSHSKAIDISLLSGSWEYDVSTFFNKGYSDIFYSNCFSYDKNNLLYIDNIYNVVNDRNSDVEFGCKRVSYEKSGYQFNFFAPIYCDNIDDLPDCFKMTINLYNSEMFYTEKVINIDLTDTYKQNYLNLYLKRYFTKIDDNVIYMLPDSSQATYNGIDVLLGGFNQYKDNVISKVYCKETTINGFDACISGGFKRNNMIIKQIMPLSFYFNVNDFLTDVEQLQYKNSNIYVKGEYYKDGKPIDFYMFDDNYDNLSLPVLSVNKSTGNLEYKYNSNNILSLYDNYGIDTVNVDEYKYSNKINKTYNRWKLKYSSDKHPYITNANYNFSKNQGLFNIYYEYPQNYYWSSFFCEPDNKEMNILLPINKNKAVYSDANYLVNKFNLTIGNYVSNWFDMTNEKTIDYIINNTDWYDVHSADNKVFYKGLLYNFNDIYNNNTIEHHIDKFAILLYINDNIYTNQTIKDYVCSSNNLSYTIANNIVVNTSYEDGDNYSYVTTTSLYNLNKTNNISYNYDYSINQYYTYNTKGTGKYVELEDLGIDFYEANKYYNYADIEDKYNNSDLKAYLSNYVVEGFNILPISYINNIYSDSGIMLPNTAYYSYNVLSSKIKLSDVKDFTISEYETRNTYVFFQKSYFISAYYANLFESSIANNNFDEFIFYPKYVTDNNRYISNIFYRLDNHNKFYGNRTSDKHYLTDADVIYIDPYNIKDKLSYYYSIKGNIYISDIKDNYIVLSDIKNTSNAYLFVDEDSKDEILYNLDYTNTYAMQEKFEYNKYNVTKLINEINSIYIKEKEIPVAYNITSYSTEAIYSYLNRSIICYSYVFDYGNSVITNNVNLSYNKYNHTSYITGGLYVSNINTEAYTIEMKYRTIGNSLMPYKNSRIILKCSDINELYSYGYILNCVSKINNRYIINRNGTGTYMYNSKSIFKHPTKLINKLYNLSYINSYTGVTYYNYGNSYYTYLLINNPEVEISDYSDTLWKSNTIVYNYKDNDKLSICNKEWIYNDGNYNTLYAKIMNLTHLVTFKKYISEYALSDNKNAQPVTYSNVNDYIYIKKKQITTSNNNIVINDVFISLADLFGDTDLTDSIHQYSDYLFTIDNYGDEPIELYFKKNFIRLNNSIYKDIIQLSDVINYKDLYLYRLETDNDTARSVKYITDIDKYVYKAVKGKAKNPIILSESYSLVPFFSYIYLKDRDYEKIYDSYCLNQLSEVNYYDDNYNITYTLYRYNKNDKLCLIDVSYIPDLSTATYKDKKYSLNTSYQSFIYNSEVVRTSEEDTYSYCSNIIPTYDKVYSVNSDYINITNNEEIPFDKYKINTYTYNGVTYGFYLNEMNIKNINSIFNLTDRNFNNVKYFTYVNGKSIINNHDYITSIFKLLLPSVKYNILNKLYDIPVLNKQYKSTFNKLYNNYVDNNGIKHIIYDKNRIDTISLYRYYDSIVPYMIKTTNIETEYLLNAKFSKNVTYSNNIYNDNINIYKYKGIRVYNNEGNYTLYKQLEYKYFNDNKFINLETYFDMFIGNNLTFEQVTYYSSDDIIKKYFKKHINSIKTGKFTDDEILFLYNKYKVTIVSVPIKLNNKYNNKIYTLTYKFTLK